MIGKLFTKSKGSKSKHEPAHISSAVQESILRTVGASSIPTMPAAAQKAFQLSTDPKAEARDFIEIIESDEALSARVIKIANSVYFDRGHKSETIEESVTVIGINELRCLLNATTLSEIFPSRIPLRSQLWANDIATALLSRQICLRLNPAKAEIAFLAGLMHDVGKLLLLQRAEENYRQVVAIVESSGQPFVNAEAEIFPFDHTEVGLLIAEKWNFGEELKAAIRNHHLAWDQAEVAAQHFSLPLVVKCADILAHSIGLGQPKSMNKFRIQISEELEQVWSYLRIPLAEQRAFISNCERQYNLECDLFVGKKIDVL
ncbi:MAG: HDOD domain-containing protein [Bdellovibrionales bacterium]|nr:HDOD domain-containing protein [Bdellovibrionales bacterium]